jgi:hypothetical protein
MSLVICLVVLYCLGKLANGFCKQFFTKRCLILFGILVTICTFASLGGQS